MLNLSNIITALFIFGKGTFFLGFYGDFYFKLSEQYKGRLNYPKIYLQQFLLQIGLLYFVQGAAPALFAMIACSSSLLLYGFIKGDVTESAADHQLNKKKHLLATINRVLGLIVLATVVYSFAQVHFLMMLGGLSALAPTIIKELINLDKNNKIFNEKLKKILLTLSKYMNNINMGLMLFYGASSGFSLLALFPFIKFIALTINYEKTVKWVNQIQSKFIKIVRNINKYFYQKNIDADSIKIKDIISSENAEIKKYILQTHQRSCLQEAEITDEQLEPSPSCVLIREGQDPNQIMKSLASFVDQNPIEWNIAALVDPIFSKRLHSKSLGRNKNTSIDEIKKYEEKINGCTEILEKIKTQKESLQPWYLSGLKRLIILGSLDQEFQKLIFEDKREDILKDPELILNENMMSRLLPKVLKGKDMQTVLQDFNKKLITKIREFADLVEDQDKKERILIMAEHLSFYVGLELNRKALSAQLNEDIDNNYAYQNDLLDLICLFAEAADGTDQNAFFNLVERYESTILIGMPIKRSWNSSFLTRDFFKSEEQIDADSIFQFGIDWLKNKILEQNQNQFTARLLSRIETPKELTGSFGEKIEQKTGQTLDSILNTYVIPSVLMLNEFKEDRYENLKKIFEKIDHEFINQLSDAQLALFIKTLIDTLEEDSKTTALESLSEQFNLEKIYDKDNAYFDDKIPSCDVIASEYLSNFKMTKLVDEKLLKIMNEWARKKVGPGEKILVSEYQRQKEKQIKFYDDLLWLLQERNEYRIISVRKMSTFMQKKLIDFENFLSKIKNIEFWSQLLSGKVAQPPAFEAHQTVELIQKHSSILPFVTQVELADPTVKSRYYQDSHTQLKSLDSLFINDFSKTSFMIESIIDPIIDFSILNDDISIEAAIITLISQFEKNIIDVKLPFNAESFRTHIQLIESDFQERALYDSYEPESKELLDENAVNSLSDEGASYESNVNSLSDEGKNKIKNIFRFYVLKHFLDSKLWTVNNLQYDTESGLREIFELKQEPILSEQESDAYIQERAALFKESGRDLEGLIAPSIGLLSYSCRSYFSPKKIEENLKMKKSVFS